MKKLWIISHNYDGCLGYAESREDAIRWLVRSGWLKLDDEKAVSWFDKKGQYYEKSVRESAGKLEMPLEEFLIKVLAHKIDNCLIDFTLSEEEMVEHDDKPLE